MRSRNQSGSIRSLLIDKCKKRNAQKNAIREEKTKDIRKKSLKLYTDCIYRSHIDPAKIFGTDVSFCFGGEIFTPYFSFLNHYITVPFSEFAEGSYMFELTFIGDPKKTLRETKSIDHHAGTSRGRLILEDDNLNISRIFFDPTEIPKENIDKWRSHFQLKQPEYQITLVPINREEITENMAFSSTPSIKLRYPHPDHVVKWEERKEFGLFASSVTTPDAKPAPSLQSELRR